MEDPLNVKFVEVSKSSTGFRLSEKPLVYVRKCEFQKIFFNYDIIATLLTLLRHSPQRGD